VVGELIDDFFNPYPSIDEASINTYFYPNYSQNNIQNGNLQANLQALAQIKTNYTDKKRSLEIPKLNLIAPIIFPKNTDLASLTKELDNGVIYYPGSVYPGEKGEIVILGHSAPPGWPKIKYDWVFSQLDKLEPGDVIFLDLNNKQYTYRVKQKAIVKKGQEAFADSLSADKNTLILISCWPPGKELQRIAVLAELD
jgi:LPXTG-site transpeptidase (sortase) family protein